MDDADFQSRLSQIETRWSWIKASRERTSSSAAPAQAALLDRYRGALFRYVLVLTRNVDDTEELLQEFAVRFLKGDFAKADAHKGSFRAYLKTSIIRMVSDQRRRKRQLASKEQSLENHIPPQEASASPRLDDFDESWRNDLLSRAFKHLEVCERETTKPYHTVLTLRSQFPKLSSTDLAILLNDRLGLAEPISSVAFRKLVQRAREKLVSFLLDEVAASIRSTDRHDLELELIACGLWEYCRPTRD